MASKRIGQSAVNWSDLIKNFRPKDAEKLQAFKAKSNAILQKLSSLPETTPTIDWSYYKSKIANTALVEEFEKQYKNVKIPYPTAKDIYASIDEEEKQFEKTIIQFNKESDARVWYYEDSLKLINSLPHLVEWTEEEFAYHYPEKALRPMEKPTLHPHTEEYQHNEESLSYLRRWGYVSKPDCYHP